MKTLTGEKLLDIAADKVKRFVQKYDPHRLYVFVSGGKDSTAALAAVAYAGDHVVRRAVIVYNEIVGNTHPLNVRQVYNVVRKLGFGDNWVVVETPPRDRIRLVVYNGARLLHIRARGSEGDFWACLRRWGIPVLRRDIQRWCKLEFKDRNWSKLPAEIHNGALTRFLVVGVKTSDSSQRAKRWSKADTVTWSNVFPWKDGKTRVFDYACSPVLKFSREQVWSILEEAGLDKELVTYHVCEDSLNCVLCPLRGLEKQEKILRFVAKTPEGRKILQRALEALKSLNLAKSGTFTRQRSLEWIQLIEKALAEVGVDGS